jgi:hypothetical protein
MTNNNSCATRMIIYLYNYRILITAVRLEFEKDPTRDPELTTRIIDRAKDNILQAEQHYYYITMVRIVVALVEI